MTKRGHYRPISDAGKQNIESVIKQNGGGNFHKGLIETEYFLVHELPSELKKNKKKNAPAEYEILGGNHRYELFIQYGIKEWKCVVLAPTCDDKNLTEEEYEILAGFHNSINEDATASSTWIEYFEKMVRYLYFPNVLSWKKSKYSVDWARVYRLSGNRDGLLQSIASKMVTPCKISDKLEAKDSPLLQYLLELNKKYGVDCPIKQTSFLESKSFWELASNPDVQIQCLKEIVLQAVNKKQVTAKVFNDIACKYLRRMNIIKGVENLKVLVNYEPYTQAVLDGKLSWLEEACQESIAGPSYQHFVAAIKAKTPLEQFKPIHVDLDVQSPPGTPVTVNKSPTAHKPQRRLPPNPFIDDEAKESKDGEEESEVKLLPSPTRLPSTAKDADKDSNAAPWKESITNAFTAHFSTHIQNVETYGAVSFTDKAKLIYHEYWMKR